MIFLICITVGSLIGLAAAAFDDWGFDLGLAFLGCFVGGLVGLLVAAVLWFVATAVLPAHDVATRYDLVSLKDGAGIEGGFFLGSGGVNDTLTHTWYQREADTSYTGHSTEADQSKVFQDSPKTPYLVQYRAEFDWRWARWLIPLPGDFATDARRYQFHIPKDSIKSGFVLNGGQQ